MKKVYLVLSLFILVGCSQNGSSTSQQKENSSKNTSIESSDTSKNEASKTIKTENGDFSVKLPTGWKEIEATELNDEADLSLENSKKSMYTTVLSESSEDYVDFKSFEKNILESIDENFDSKEDEVKKKIDSNGWSGTRYSFITTMDGLYVFLIYDIVQSDSGHYVQKMAWTNKSQKNRKELEFVLDSIIDVSK